MSILSSAELEQALKILETRERKDSFDPGRPGSKPTKEQSKFLHDIGKPQAKFRIARAANQSGKSATVAWEVAKVITETHPWWNRPDEWGDGTMKAIIAGQDRKMMELEIWEGKLLPHLVAEEWHVTRTGMSISHATHKPTGNQLIFLSHSDASEKARKHMQGYVVNYLWIDEMPAHSRIWEELEKRIVSRNGYLVASFTSKVRSPTTKMVVENHCKNDYCSLYRFKMLDNPALADRKEEILAQMAGYPESYRNAVLYGDWYSGDSAVYHWEPHMMESLPEDYSKSWRHLEACDPAMNSKMGHLIMAEHPHTGNWYLIKSEYIEHLASPRDYVEEALKRTATYNIKTRVSDIASWYTQEASANYGVHYQNPHKKTERKQDLIKGLQLALSSGKIRVTPSCREFIEEIGSCQWSETAPGKIINGQAYHCLDAATYAADALPKWDGPTAMHHDYHINLKMKHRENQVKEAKEKRVVEQSSSRQRPMSYWTKQKRTRRHR